MLLFRKKSSFNTIQKTLLDKSELLDLRQCAEQIDCSGSPALMLESRQSGNLGSHALGSGIDYAESRVYQPGDDTRLINWRLSARSHETFVKTFRIESKPSISVFLDRRRSMVFGTQKRLKITQAARIACLLAYAAEYHQLGFQAWILNENGIQSFDSTEAFLLQANQACSTATHDTNLGIGHIFQAKKFAPLTYLISDFNDFSDNCEKAYKADLARLSEQCFIQAIHIMDKAELQLPAIAKIRLQDMNSNSSYQLDSNQSKDRELFSKLANQSFEKRKAVFDSLGIAYKQLATDVENLQNHISMPLGQGMRK